MFIRRLSPLLLFAASWAVLAIARPDTTYHLAPLIVAGAAAVRERNLTAASRVFSPIVDGRILSITADATAFVDNQTSSVWDITGQAVSGELAGSTLARIHHFDTFWFAWATYQPGTELTGG